MELFPELSRSKIQSLIEKQQVSICLKPQAWQVLKKPSQKIKSHNVKREDFKIQLSLEDQYVSRGALKLKKAFDQFKLNPKGKTCLDVGLSTGGFSDFLLKQGASRILGIDVGQDQLHPSLRKIENLTFYDKVNARYAIDKQILEIFFANKDFSFDFIVVDVSFISLTLVIPNLVQYLHSESHLVLLIKPQFELTRKDLNKKGVVKDPLQTLQVVEKISGVLQENGLKILGHCHSPIEGENGNQEVLMVACCH